MISKFLDGVTSIQEENPQLSPLRTPDFLSKLVTLANIMRLLLKKGAHAALSGAAWQEIGYAPVEMTIHLGNDT
jgi:hypothetical protein